MATTQPTPQPPIPTTNSEEIPSIQSSQSGSTNIGLIIGIVVVIIVVITSVFSIILIIQFAVIFKRRGNNMVVKKTGTLANPVYDNKGQHRTNYDVI